MSLPSRIYFFKNKEEIGSGFCNVGWTLYGIPLLRCIKESIEENKELWEACDSIILYHIEISKEFILQHTDKEIIAELDRLIDIGTKEYIEKVRKPRNRKFMELQSKQNE